MKRFAMPALALLACLCSCSSGTPVATPAVVMQGVTSVTPSKVGTPNSVAAMGSFEFVSVQGAGQIFTYNLASGVQALASTYATPCKDPSGMAIASISGVNVMAVVCYDAGSLLTLTVHADGSLAALGSVTGLPGAYPGTALVGTDVLIPLFGQNHIANGAVAKVSIANPASPVLAGLATLASPGPNEFANPGYLTVAGGYIYVAAGSESAPIDTSSTIQIVNLATMTLVGTPLSVAHSPQQLAVQNGVVYATFYDAVQLESIDVADPANLKVLQIVPLRSGGSTGGSASAPGCHAIPIALRGTYLYTGCYDEGTIERVDISIPTAMSVVQTLTGIQQPQRLVFTADALLAPSSAVGGAVYRIGMGVQ